MIRTLLGILFLLAIAAPTWGACSNTTLGGSIVCITEAHAFNSASGTNLSLGNFSTNPAVGNTIWVYQTIEGTGASGPTCNTSTPTDTLGNTFSLVISVSGGSSVFGPACIYVAPVTIGGSTDAVTITFSASVTNRDGDALLLSGLTSSPVDKSCSGQTSGTNPTCSASITPTVNGELILAGCAFANGTLGVGTNFTAIDSPLNTVDNTEYYVQPTAGAITPAYTDSSSGAYNVLAVSLKPAAASVASQAGGFIPGP